MQKPAVYCAPPLSVLSGDVVALVADSVICTDEDGRILLFNRAAERCFGYSALEVIGKDLGLLLPQRHRTEHARLVQTFALEEGDSNRVMGHLRQVWGLRKNGEEFPSEATVSRHSVDGRTILTVVHRDVTERKQLEDQREAIAHELDHRIKNVISVVNALVWLSAKNATSVTELRDALQDRLRGMAATQDFLRQGVGKNISLSELLLAELGHYRSTDKANIVIKGEPMVLSQTAVQPLALAIHELATNSVKYGALSDPNGRVIVTYDDMSLRDENLLLLEWQEAGGPPVKPPDKQGFGTTFVEQVIRRTLEAEVNFDYRPEGLVCRMTLPRAKLEDSPSAGTRAMSF